MCLRAGLCAYVCARMFVSAGRWEGGWVGV